MSSIPVISHNVIRQAIEWHGETQPRAISTGSNFKFPDGRQQATLYLHMSLAQVMKDHNLGHFHETAQYAYLYSLQNCFCNDITVVDLTWQPEDDQFIVALSCIIKAHDNV